MIFTKKYIRQVIMEEMTDYVAMKNKIQSGKSKKLDNLQTDLIKFFSYYRDIVTDKTSIGVDDAEENHQKFKKALVSIKVEYGIKGSYAQFLKYCVDILSDVADPQLVTFIRNIVIKSDKAQNYSDKLDNYGMSISPEEEKFIVPKSDRVEDEQIDDRKNQKNYWS